MTREEAIDYLTILGGIESITANEAMALEIAIEALEQEPILDKVKAEMFEEMLSHSGTGEEVIQAYVDGLKKGLDIIDKYKGESEDK